ncbi:MAG: Fe-S protein assembly co-chaperone HscB [Candidatus Manganitrophaceae bacterium]
MEIESPHFCSHCATLQPFPEGIDYFTVFGLGPLLNIDLSKLEEKFYDLSRKFHPDFYQRKSVEEARISLENSAILNQAYRTLKDPIRRVEYLLGSVEGKKEIPTQAPGDLFEEILELQELLEGVDEASADPKKKSRMVDSLKKVQACFQEHWEEGNRSLDRLSLEWDREQERPIETRKTQTSGSGLEETKRILAEIKQVLSHRGYLERALENVQSGINKMEKGE